MEVLLLFAVFGGAIYMAIQNYKMNKKYGKIIDVDKAVDDLKNEQRELESLLRELQSEIGEIEVVQSGFYKSQYDFGSSEEYKEELDRIRAEQKMMLKDKQAAVCHQQWEVSGSKKEGQKMTDNQIKMALRAFNGECDAATAKVNYSNISMLESRIFKARKSLNAMLVKMHIEITDEYMDLKLKELALAHEYQEKKQAEKEEQRMIKEQMREEARALKEIEKAQADAEKEEKQYQDALEQARKDVEAATGSKHDEMMQKIALLEQKLSEARENKERAISRAQLTRSGHVYVISNVGSFGDNVFKIGMTRRLEPMDRVKELGDASVPFAFDVHAMIYTEDAPGLENMLHKYFTDKRVNMVNERKEFFEVSLDDVRRAVKEHHGEFEFTLLAEAMEYRQTVTIKEEKAA